MSPPKRHWTTFDTRNARYDAYIANGNDETYSPDSNRIRPGQLFSK